MVPSIGRIVHYALTDVDVIRINRRRTNPVSILERIKVLAWPLGAQAHVGNEAREGQVFPAMIVRTFGSDPTSLVNLQVFLDGSDVVWLTSVSVGDFPGSYAWPVRT